MIKLPLRSWMTTSDRSTCFNVDVRFFLPDLKVVYLCRSDRSVAMLEQHIFARLMQPTGTKDTTLWVRYYIRYSMDLEVISLLLSHLTIEDRPALPVDTSGDPMPNRLTWRTALFNVEGLIQGHLMYSSRVTEPTSAWSTGPYRVLLPCNS